MASRCGVGSTSQRLVNVAWMTTASGRLLREQTFVPALSAPHLDGAISAHIGYAQSRSIDSIPGRFGFPSYARSHGAALDGHSPIKGRDNKRNTAESVPGSTGAVRHLRTFDGPSGTPVLRK